MNVIYKMKINLLCKKTILWWTFSIFIYVSFCGCDKAADEIPRIPLSFSRQDIYTVIRKARANYIDPDKISNNYTYVKAAQNSLSSLPYSLSLWSKEYYNKRAKWEEEKPLIPGRPIFINPKDPYLIFVPDYDKWDVIAEKRKEERKKRNKGLKNAERRKLFFKERAKREKVRKLRLDAWKRTKFSGKHFAIVLDWLENNWQKYKELPEVYKKKREKKKKKKKQKASPYGLHKSYFAASNGFLDGIDPHSSLVLKRSWNKMLSKSEDASFEGIGAMLRGGSNYDVVVETPLPGSPALNSGLRAGDIIRKVDGEDIEDMPLSQVVKLIRGKKGTDVILHVERPTELRNLDVKIKRDVIKQLAVTSELYDQNRLSPEFIGDRKIGVIQIKSFLYAKRKTSKLVEQAYKDLLEKSNSKLTALILDLRSNPGGYLGQAVAVADLFLPPKKRIVTVKGKKGTRHLGTRRPVLINKDKDKSIPLLVLINSGSASASEILASALQDYNLALVLGERSFGKATVQTVTPSVTGCVMKLTSARYYAPKGYTVQVLGIKPDIKLSNEEDGTFPPRFREENMWDHLPHLEKYEKSKKRKKWIAKIKKFVGSNKQTEKYIQKHKNDALRVDYMLVRSLAYIEALKKYPAPK